jgi:mannose-P-dolichol utilization defect protein 1
MSRLRLIIPLLLAASAAAQEFRFGVFSPECYENYFTHGKFDDTACFKLTLSKALGYAIVVGSFLLKAPQIAKIVTSGSVEGLSVFSCYLDVLVFQSGMSYNLLRGYPLSTFAESIVIYVQNVVIVLLIWNKAKPTVPLPERVAFILALAGHAAGVSYALPPQHWHILPTIGIGLTVWSRVPQIWTNFRNGHTGQLALATWALNALGALARVFTTIQEVDDPVILAGFTIGCSLSFIIVAQILWYWNATEKAVARASKKKAR